MLQSRLGYLLAVALLSSLPAAVAQDHPNHGRGLEKPTAYDFSNLDSINLFNGNLTLAVPIGIQYPAGGSLSYGLTLRYNSNVWEFEQGPYDNQSQPTVTATPDPHSNAGMGWILSLGRLWAPNTPPFNDGTAWLLVEADGTRRVFWPTLHPGETEVSGVYYSRDGSYLRLKTNTKEVSSPDGVKRFFDDIGRLSEIRDPFGNQMSVVYSAALWTITDSAGGPSRTHQVAFFPSWHPNAGQVKEVRFAMFGGGQAVYSFVYRLDNGALPVIPRHFKHTSQGLPGGLPNTFSAQLLESITQPDGSVWRMSSYESNLIDTQCVMCNASGTLHSLTLPTLGRLEWEYEAYRFSGGGPDPTEEWHQSSEGVRFKRVFAASGTTPIATWHYRQGARPDGSIPAEPTREARTWVTDPLGNEMVNYFEVYDGSWQHGLPFSTQLPYGTRFLSSEIFRGGAVPANRLRREYIQMEADPNAIPGNQRLKSSMTVFDDDGGMETHRDSSGFDGFGHYETAVVDGTIPAGTSRTTTTDYDPQSTPWILNIFKSQTVSEGTSTARTDYCFDQGTGFLKRKRVLKSGTTAGPNDVVAVYTPDTQGNVDLEEYFGGDVQGLGSTALCSLSLPANKYAIDHTYSFGALATSTYTDPSGPGGLVPFRSVHNDIDLYTGLISASHEASSSSDAGLVTSYEYDAMGRLRWVKPPAGHDAWQEFVYDTADGAAVPNPASAASDDTANVVVNFRPNGSPSGSILKAEQVVFDSLGRVWRESARLPGGSWNVRETLYDAAGNKASVSEAVDWTSNPVSKKTSFLSYDPFGRPGSIRAPDFKVGNLTYLGVREITREVKVATSSGGSETSAFTTESYDRHGRLYEVKEPANTNGTNTTTTYSYDVGGRLSWVRQQTAVGTQNRYFTYDNRGFLQSESHPEKVGLVKYESYDPLGKPTSKTDGGVRLTLAYDRAGRLTDAWEATSASRRLKQLTYGTANGPNDWKLGKLTIASRTNYPVGTTRPATVSDSYSYGGRGGRTSARQTSITLDGATNEIWNLAQSYDSLGNVTSLTYPDCDPAFAACAASPRTVTFAYDTGRLAGVTGYASGITYRANGSIAQVTHASGNGVVDTYGADANSMLRPSSITAAKGPYTLWSTGAFQYDGAGNVKRIGISYFVYDKVSRLVDGHVNDGRVNPTSGTPQKFQTYSYDAFGNINSIGGTSARSTPTSPTTNRLTGTNYDDAGNLKAWNGQSYEYDAFNQMIHFCSATPCPGATGEEWFYMYNADDERFWSFKVGASPRFDRYTLRGLDGKVLREYANSGYTFSLKTDFIYRDGQLLAEESPTGQRHFHLDHLGTPRLITGINGPAGGVWTGAGGNCKPAPADYDGDGRAEFSMLCGGAWHFYNDDGSYRKGIWTGCDEGCVPVPANYDGIGGDDVVAYDDGAWHFWDYGTAAYHGVWTGPGPGCSPAPADYDGDGNADLSLLCGGAWQFYNDNGTYLKGVWTGAANGQVAVPGDYDADPAVDLVISNGLAWNFFDYASGSSTGAVWTGVNGTAIRAAPMDFDGDGKMDLATYADGAWHFFNPDGTYFEGVWTGGVAGDLTVPANFRGDRTEEPVIFRGGAWLFYALGGMPVAYHAYYPFGEEVTSTTQDAERMKFTAHERDLGNAASVADDLDYMHARHYGPLTGRFLSFDPVGGNAKTPQSWNRYAYVLGNPAKFTDPTGEITGATIANSFQLTVEGLGDQWASHCASLSLAGLACATTILNASDLVKSVVDPLKWGDALGTAIGSEAGVASTMLAGAVDGLRGAAVIAPLATAGFSRAGAAAASGGLDADIASTFRGGFYRTPILKSDVTAFRYSGGTTPEAGRFLTTRQTVRQIGSPSDAKQLLNLPSGNTAENLTAFTIPRGTTTYIGRVEGGGAKATQIFITDKGVLVRVK